MKHQIRFILFFLLIGINTTTFAQQNDSTIIKITLPTTENWKIADTVSLETTHPIFDQRKMSYFEKIDSTKNEWTIKIYLGKPSLYHFLVKRKIYNYLVIFPNDEIEITFDEERNYIFSKSKLTREYQTIFNNQNKYNTSHLVKYEWQEYLEKVDSVKKLELVEYELAFKDEKPNPIFDAYFRNKVASSHNSAFGYYPFFRNRYLKKQEMVAIMPDEYFETEPKISYHIPIDLQKDYPYTNDYLMGVSSTLAKEGNCAEQGKAYQFENFHCIYQNTEKIDTPKLKKLLALHSLEGMTKQTEWSNLSQTEIVENAFMSLEKEFPNDEDISYLKNKAKNLKRFAKGQPAPNFTLKDENGKTVSLSDFRGKYVLIDFWATGCKPCIAEHPFSKKLEEEFTDKNIAFLYVCLDSQEETWKKLLKKIPLEGTQIFANRGEENNKIKKVYNIEGVPVYIFLDKEGNFISTNARPSQNAKQIIEKALADEK